MSGLPNRYALEPLFSQQEAADDAEDNGDDGFVPSEPPPRMVLPSPATDGTYEEGGPDDPAENAS